MILSSSSGRSAIPQLFALPRLATIFSHTAITTLTLPLIVIEAVGDGRKGFHLGMISGCAAVLGLAVLILSGRYTDRHFGRRDQKTYPLLALFLSLFPLALLARGGSYSMLVGAVIALSATRAICNATHLPILAGPCAPEPRERLSAAVAFQHFLGTGLAAAAFGLLTGPFELFGISFYSSSALIALGLVLLAMAGFYFSCDSSKYPVRQTEKGYATPKGAPLFPQGIRLFIGARIFFMAGTLILGIFLVFFVRDVLGAREVKVTTALLYTGSMAGSLISARFAGRLIKLKGEFFLLRSAGFAVATSVPFFLFLGPHSFSFALGAMILYGAGAAALMAAAISLSVILIPHPSGAGRVMAIITGSIYISQLLAATSGAIVLDFFNEMGTDYGYYALFIMVEVFFVTGGVFLHRLKGVAVKNGTFTQSGISDES